MNTETESTLEDLFHKTRAYADTQIELLKLKAIDKSAKIFAVSATGILLIVIFLLAVILFSIGFALLLGHAMGSYTGGFFVIGGVYLLSGLVIYFSRKKLMHSYLGNLIIRVLTDD